jgi:ABC-type sulfate transport system permease subunit
MEIFDHIIFGNSIHDYVLFAIIFTLGLVFKRIFSRGISKLFFRLFTQNGTNSSALVFVSLLLRPIELLIMSVVCYWAINQLDYPLKEVLFSRENIINNVTTYYQIRVVNVIDKLFLFFLILCSHQML